MSRYFRAFGTALAAVFFTFWSVADTGGPTNLNFLVHGMSILIALFLFVQLVRTSREFGPDEWLGSPQLADMDLATLRAAMIDALQTHAEPTRVYFMYVLFRLPEYLLRVDEQVTPARRGSEVRATMSFRVDQKSLHIGSTDKEPDYVLLPVFRCKRGERIDELIVKDNMTGQHAPRLPREESLAITSLALRTLIRREASQLTPPVVSLNSNLLDRFLLDICNGKRIDINTRLNEVLGTASRQFDRLVQLCDYLSKNYLIIAELGTPLSTQSVVEVEHFVCAVSPAPESRGRMRKRFGLAPVTIELPMTYALQAQIYHFQLSAPADQYVYNHRLELLNTNYLVKQPDLQPYGQPYVRVYHEDGRTNAHCYIRPRSKNGSADTPPPDMKSVVEVREIPPGALGAATIVATAIATLLIFFAITRIAIDGPGVGSEATSLFNSDIPAVLLALPAFAALLLGHWADPTRLPRSSLSAYCGFLVTMFLSFLAAIFFILDANRIFGSQAVVTIWRTQGTGSLHLTTDWIWLALAGFAAAHALYLMGRLRGELRYYMKLPKELIVSQPLG